MRVLITGASGFVGRAACAWLAAQGFDVAGAVRRPPDRPLAGVEYRTVGDLGAATDWSAALAGVDAVVHCAARVHVMREAAADPLAAFRAANVAGTERLARQAAAAGVKRLVFLSSIKVNGEETASPFSQHGGDGPRRFTEDDPPAPRGPYGQTKWEAETMLARVVQETGLEMVIVRPPLVHGPGVKGNLARLIGWIERGVPLPLAGIRNARSLIGLDNLVSALQTCLTHPAAAGRTYLVRDGEDISTRDLARRLALHLGKPTRLFALPAPLLEGLAAMIGRRDEIRRLTGSLTIDDSRIRSELGWAPPRRLDEGLEKMARGWREKRQNA